MSNGPEIPDHIKKTYGSARKYKQKKRQDLAKVRKALDELRSGCYYLPGGGCSIVGAVDHMLTQLSIDMGCKRWGR